MAQAASLELYDSLSGDKSTWESLTRIAGAPIVILKLYRNVLMYKMKVGLMSGVVDLQPPSFMQRRVSQEQPAEILDNGMIRNGVILKSGGTSTTEAIGITGPGRWRRPRESGRENLNEDERELRVKKREC
ncbi:UNVERIFIED_CONTAM: hypothetical protein PYX00_002879 [Menopon gallinae]|uniref:Uncharacterized protein n=1 Tax=Menopon gallinae TaxID=328185 RepID=A0AAW2HYU4_9NEOP